MFSMESIIRNVREIDHGERQALEHVLGRELAENQQVIIQIVTLGNRPLGETRERGHGHTATLPPWCDVYAGFSDAEIADVETAVRERSDITRPSP